MNLDTYKNISNELKVCFSNNSLLRSLLPLDAVLVFGGLIILFITSILGIYIGTFIPVVVYYAFLLGLLLAYANFHNIFLYSGLFTYGAIKALSFLKHLIFDGYFSWSLLISGLIFGSLGYIVLKESRTSGISSTGFSG